MKRIVYFLIVFFLFFSSPIYSWNALGHQVVAAIAYQKLDPPVRTKVDGLISNFQKEYPEISSFKMIAPWPDALRFQKIETFTHWHYINVAFTNDKTKVKNKIDTDNAVWAVDNIINVLRNEQANPYERARFLAFLVHIVGDLHQPLHTVNYFSAAHQDGDLGGNLYYIRYQNDSISLHKLWDAGIDDFIADPTEANTDALAANIIALYPETYFDKKALDLNLNDWLQEGLVNAKKYVYTTPENQLPVPDYLETGKKIAEQQTALAGYRLAHLLNQVLG